MTSNLLVKHGLRFIILMLVQVVIFNNIRFMGYINALFYIWFIIALPTNMNRYLLLIIAFLTGLILDIFSSTPGMYAFTTVLIAFIRPYALHLFVPKDVYALYEPSVKTLGFTPFLKYAVSLVVILHLTLFTLEAFTFQNYWLVLLKTAINSAITLLFVMAAQKYR